ncbi:MAG: ATPase, T2SS/T4P/T4SS family [Patescibacteria group bacterium]|nr:type II/IV secretion system protein [Patescibacteria group bacterium]MBU1870535.1 type II/IV secretion system protein [Patescibacteria group bacterium]
MANSQSIESLLNKNSSQNVNDETVQDKFNIAQQKIKIKEMEKFTKQKAASLGVSYIDLLGFPVNPTAIILINEEEAQSLSVVCFFYNGKQLRLATTKPKDEAVLTLIKNLADKYFCQTEIYLISEHSLSHALKIYKTVPRFRAVERGVKITEDDLNKYGSNFNSFQDLQKQITKVQTTEIVTMILAAAIKTNVSDIHIEIGDKEIKARFRIDGVLHDAVVLDNKLWPKIIARFKILSGVKINITDKPQDGRISIYLKNDRLDIRVSFLPTAYGESVVMRLLRSNVVSLGFEQLGIKGRSFEQLKRQTERPNGMIVTTGPTGSGKTTTLYAILKKFNNPETKIITIEDPIEYQMAGVNQSQTNEKYTFSQGLRSIVRQDPDIIMVGEIRDLETAEVAIQAALTGHVVLSTIHTNNAAGTIPRFLSMGAKPFLLAPALNAMIGQRLVRKLCEKCKKETVLPEEQLTRIKELLEKLPEIEKKDIDFKNLKFYKEAGCDACQNIGYKGRVGIYEILIMNAELEKIILTGQVSEYDIQANAAKNNMISMVQDGLMKVLDGLTSVDEVFRVTE